MTKPSIHKKDCPTTPPQNREILSMVGQFHRFQKEIEECTFSPQINGERRKSSSKERKKLFDRLHKEGQAKQEARLQNQALRELNENQACTFKPHLLSKRGSPRPKQDEVFSKLHKVSRDLRE